MRLFEFSKDDPLRVKLTVVVDQLRSRIMDTNNKENFDTDALLELLAQNEIYVDKSDLYDMVKKAPLKNIIKNISGHKVVFVGQQDTEEKIPVDQARKTVQAMAKKALK